MIFYATIGAIAVGIALALLILQYVKGNSITLYIEINDKDEEKKDDDSGV